MYFNEFDPRMAAWLRELMADGLLPRGEVDERDIREVEAGDVVRHRRCHFFAGVGGWELALQLAGWPADRPVWTGSCPCQPFSAAGKRQGAADERDLWPELFRLIRECRPPVVFGEQVASSEVVGTELEAAFLVAVQAGEFARANKLAKRLVASSGFHFHKRWLSRIRADLATEGYSLRWKVLGAHSAGAPHVRQRLYWVAHAEHRRPGEQKRGTESGGERGNGSGVAHSNRDRADGTKRKESGTRRPCGIEPCGCRQTRGVEHPARDGRGEGRAEPDGRHADATRDAGGVGDTISGGIRGCGRGEDGSASGALPGEDGQRERVWPNAWAASRLILCRDRKYRRIPAQPALFPLAARLSGRVGLLRGAGNAIVPQTAALFIRAFLEVTED